VVLVSSHSPGSVAHGGGWRGRGTFSSLSSSHFFKFVLDPHSSLLKGVGALGGVIYYFFLLATALETEKCKKK